MIRMRTASIAVLIALLCHSVVQASPLQSTEVVQLQTETLNAERSHVDSRVDQIEFARNDKESNLQPEAEPGLQRKIKEVQKSFVYRLLNSELHGFGLDVGQLGPSSGFAVGPQFSRTDFLNGTLTFKVRAAASGSRSYLGRVDLRLGTPEGFASLEFSADHRSLSQIPYYGPGPYSLKSGRSNYRLEDTTVELRPSFMPFRHLKASGVGGFSKYDVGAGHAKQYISTEQQFSPETTLGLDKQTTFWRGGAILQFDWRDRSWAPAHGGKYTAQYLRYLDRDAGLYSFQRLDFDADQYIPLFNRTRVITFHGATSLTRTNRAQIVPFYLQPTLGGANSLRGYRSYRFYANNSVIANVEYRWEVSPTFSVSAFTDAGKVFDRWSQWDLRKAESDVGFAVAFRTESRIVFRIDTAFSHEGTQIWLRANNIF